MDKKNGIRLEIKNNIATVTINRPERMNAFNLNMFDELKRVTRELTHRLPRVVIITGSGERAFSAGFDVNPDNPMVSSLYEAVAQQKADEVRASIQMLRDSVDGFIALPVPIIAALNGLAYGGGAELAMRCDMRIINKNGTICFSEVKLGLMPDWGGGAALTHLAGPAVAADLILSARTISSEEAFSLGLINRISEKNQAYQDALELARDISQNGPVAVRHVLSLIRQSRNMTLNESLNYEFEQAVSLIASGECIHGISAFLSKKAPDFPDD